MYGSRQTLWDMTYLYQEIEDFAKIFNVEARGQAVIADFKNVKPTCAEFGKTTKTSPLFSGSQAPHLRLMPMSAAKQRLWLYC